jgi:RND superfamily putative drug exporter
MELLGDRNWWLPGWIDRLLPKIQVEGREVSDEEVTIPGSHAGAAHVPAVTGIGA